MKEFLTDEEMAKLENPDFISDEDMARMESGSKMPSGRDWAKTMTEALPLAGGAVGGVIGLAGGPLGAVGGAGLGAAAGKSLENIIEQTFLNEPKSTRQLFQEPVMSGLEGAAGEGMGQIAAKGLQAATKAIQPSLQTGAERMAARALGAERGTIKKLGADKVQALGRYALDEGLLQPFSTTDDVIAANLAKQSEGGKMMGEVYEQIDKAGASTFDPLTVAAKVDEELGGFYRDPLNKGVTNQLENTIESILMRGNKPIPLADAQALKETLGKASNWQNKLVVSEKEQLAREAYGIVNKAIDEATDIGAKAIGADDILYNLKRGKDLYSKSKGVEELLTNKFAREQGNKLMGLTDTIATSQAMSSAGPAGLAAYPLKRGLEAYGSQSAALGLDKLSKAASQSPFMQQISKSKPELFNQFVSRLGQLGLKEQEEKPVPPPKVDKNQILQKTQGSKYSQVLQNAAQNGDQSFNAAHFVLSNSNKDYRQMLEDQEQ